MHLSVIDDWRLDRPADIFIVGAAKCGTTSVHKYLDRHPDVHASARKEYHYYNQVVDRILAGGWTRDTIQAKREYQRDLDGGSSDQLNVESTPDYLRHPETAMRLHEQNPDAKILILLRDPVARFRSNYLMYRRAGTEQRTFAEVLGRGIPYWNRGLPYAELHLRHGHYGSQVRRYLDVFPRDQIHVDFLERLGPDPAGTMTDISRFLGIDPSPFQGMDYTAHNKAWNSLNRMQKTLLQSRLGAMVGRVLSEPTKAKIRNRFFAGHTIPADWTPDAQDALARYYQDEVAMLGELGIMHPWNRPQWTGEASA